MGSDLKQNQNLNVLMKILKHKNLLTISLFVIITGFLYVFLVFKAIALLSYGISSPLFPFDMFSKCHIAEDKCPNDNVTFWLYTR